MGSSYRWVIVAVGALMTCVGIGAMFSLAVYLEPMSAETGWSRAGISGAMTIDFLTMGIAGFAWGAVNDRFGTRPVVLSGALLLGLGLFLASRSTSLIGFQLTYGILVGLAAGVFLCADDRGRDAVVRQQPQPCGVPGFRRHGRRTDDDLAVRALADLDLRLAHRDDDRRPDGVGLADPGRAVGAAGAGGNAGCKGRCRQSRSRMVRRQGAALAAVPCAGADLFRVLRRAFRTDLPHGQLRDALRHPGDDRGQHLQCRRPVRAGGPPPPWHPRRPARREAGSHRRAAGASAGDRDVSLRERHWANSMRSRESSARPMAA